MNAPRGIQRVHGPVKKKTKGRYTAGRGSLRSCLLAALLGGASFTADAIGNLSLDFEPPWSPDVLRAKGATWRISGAPPSALRTGQGTCASQALEFELDPQRAKDFYRSELVLHHSKAQFGAGTWLTFGIALYFPSQYQFDDQDELYLQLHGLPDKDLGETWRPAPFYLGSRNGSWVISSAWDGRRKTPPKQGKKLRLEGRERWKLGEVRTEVWERFDIRMRLAYDHTGEIQIKKNGILVHESTGPNTYNDKRGVYLKVGLYKWPWKKRRPRGLTREQKRILIDDVTVSGDRLVAFGGVRSCEPVNPDNNVMQ